MIGGHAYGSEAEVQAELGRQVRRREPGVLKALGIFGSGGSGAPSEFCGSCLFYKISDASPDMKPFDCFVGWGGGALALELKFTRGGRMGVFDRDIKVHQRDSLLRFGYGAGLQVCATCNEACGSGFSNGLGTGVAGNVRAGLIIAFLGGGEVFFIDIWTFERMRCRGLSAGRKSISVEDCEEWGAVRV